MNRSFLASGRGTCPLGNKEVLHNLQVWFIMNHSTVRAFLRPVRTIHHPKIPFTAILIETAVIVQNVF